MTSIRIGPAEVILCPDGLTITRYAEGDVLARAHKVGTVHGEAEAEAYRKRAEAHGYADVDHFSRDHEILHSVLARWVDGKESPALLSVARGGIPGPENRKIHAAEESVVLALQAYLKLRGIGVEDLAQWPAS